MAIRTFRFDESDGCLTKRWPRFAPLLGARHTRASKRTRFITAPCPFDRVLL